MTFEEFLVFRDVKIKNSNHERIVRLFFGYAASVTGDNRLLPNLLGQLLNIDLSETTVPTGCFNGIHVYIYGSIPYKELKELKDNEYVLIVLSDDLNGSIERKANRHIYIT